MHNIQPLGASWYLVKQKGGPCRPHLSSQCCLSCCSTCWYGRGTGQSAQPHLVCGCSVLGQAQGRQRWWTGVQQMRTRFFWSSIWQTSGAECWYSGRAVFRPGGWAGCRRTSSASGLVLLAAHYHHPRHRHPHCTHSNFLGAPPPQVGSVSSCQRGQCHLYRECPGCGWVGGTKSGSATSSSSSSLMAGWSGTTTLSG